MEHYLFCFSLLPFYFCLFPPLPASRFPLLAPFFHTVSKMFPWKLKKLTITISYRWKHPASQPLVFPCVSMADEKRMSNRTHFTFPHGNTHSSVSTIFRRCFHSPEK